MYKKTKWDIRFMQLARMVATWSKDPNHQVGAVIVDTDRHILGLGYNGPPKYTMDKGLSKQQKQFRSLHAELNAILNCKENPSSGSIYIYPYAPCAQCTAALLQKGIKKIYYNSQTILSSWRASQAEAVEMINEAGGTCHCLWLKKTDLYLREQE